MTSAEAGTVIDANPLPKKAILSRRANFDSHEDVTDARKAHS
jgi:hypothetical protein